MTVRAYYLSFVALIFVAFTGIVWFNPFTLRHLTQTPGKNTPEIPSKNSLVNVTVETTHPGPRHIYGFTILDQLYMWNGTFYIVTSNESAFPTRRMMISRPLNLGPGVEAEPTATVQNPLCFTTHVF